LNRVVGGVPSNIQGALLANGQVWIQNANGVLFGSGATINVNSLLVTTKNIDTNQFMAGSNTFDLASTGTNAGIINDGTITAAGYVTLVGDQIRNTGTINAKQVTLAAGDSATLALDNGQGISVTLTNSTANALVENSGRIVAGNNGSVLLTAQGKDTLLDTVINLSGVIKAGTIVADAGITGDVVVTGDLDASNQNGQGGTVVLSGNRVGLFDDATVNVSGDAGGGLAIIGGDKLNKIPGSSATNLINEVAFADYTQIDSGVKVDAGSTNGDGGFVETSGKLLSVQGAISAAAPNGKSGLWLIDPTDVTISGTNTNVTNPDGSPPNFTINPGSADTAVVNNTSIINALNANTDVLITTVGTTGAGNGNITQVAGADINTTGTAALTLEALGNITINANIAAVGAGKLDLNLTADVANAGVARVFVTGGIIDLRGGDLTIRGNATQVSGTNGVALNGTVTNIGTGTITGIADDVSGVLLGTGSIFNVSTGSNVTISGTSNSSAGVSLSGQVTVSNNGTLDIGGISNSGSGVVVSSNVKLLDDATLTLSGNSTSGNGVNFQPTSDLNLSGNSTAEIKGNSNGAGSGVAVQGTMTAANNGSLTINGTSINNSGFVVSGSVTLLDDVTLLANGTSANSTGVNFQTPSNLGLSGNSTATLNGNGAAGVALGGNTTVTDNSSMTANGTGTATAGITLVGNFTVNGSGDVTLNGTATNDITGSSSVRGVSITTTTNVAVTTMAR
jgi:hypothetical protein